MLRTARLEDLKRLAWAIAVAAAALSHGRAAAQSDGADDGAAVGSRTVAVLVQGGVFSGWGGGVQVGTRDVGLRATVGWAPTFLSLDRAGDRSLHFYSGLAVAPDLYVRLLSARTTTHVGLQGGYRYSTLFGHGGAFGVYVQARLARAVDFLVGSGVQVFPDGPDRFRRDQGLAGVDFGLPGPGVHIGATVGLVLFP